MQRSAHRHPWKQSAHCLFSPWAERTLLINKNGEERYGYVAYVREDLDGTEIDGQSDLELKVDVYFEEYDDSRYYYDKVQFNDEGFTGKKFVKVKMLNGEINVINEIVDLDNVPLNIKNGLLRLKDKNFLNIKDIDENTIEVNGKKYIRVD